MQGTRRETPTPQDFAAALANAGITSSSLDPFLQIPPTPSICQPQITFVPEPEKAPPSLDMVLGPSLQPESQRIRQKYVPKHLPALPSAHTWKSTSLFSSREQDARKLRERATKEGVMAEQSLRRLMEASKSHDKIEDSRYSTLKSEGRSKVAWAAALAAVEKTDQEETEKNEHAEMDIDNSDGMLPLIGAKKTKFAPNESLESGTAVNCERMYWREAARSKT